VSAVAPVITAANIPSAIGVFNISPVPAVIGIPVSKRLHNVFERWRRFVKEERRKFRKC
jgi:hypothetical protein